MQQISLFGKCSFRSLRGLLIEVALALVVLPCHAGEAVFEYLDYQTAASITGAAQPLVFARERTDLAAHGRDYVTLTAIEINRQGKRKYFWWGYIWSTIDRRGDEKLLAPRDEFVLMADGRPIRLTQRTVTPRDEGIVRQPTPPPLRTAIPVLFSADLEAIAYVAHASSVQIELVRAGLSEAFPLWKERNGALDRFVAEVQ